MIVVSAGCGWTAAGRAESAAPGAALLVPAALAPGSTPAATPAAEIPSALRIRLESPNIVVAGIRLHARLLRQFYAAHGDELVWPYRPAQAASLLAAVLRAGDQGLDPQLFHVGLLQKPAGLSPIDHDLLLSDAFLGYADALSRGALPIEDRYDDEDLTPGPVDVAAALDAAINSPDPGAAIDALAPNSPAYRALRQALRRYQAAAAAPAPATAAPPGRRAAAAEMTNADRVRSIIVNLERLRWLPRPLPPDRVWVNTAKMQLVLYRANLPIFTTRVIVGQTTKQTPEFETTINSLLFNPPWNVPASIADSEILPKLATQPDYLARHHMFFRSNGAIQQKAGPYSALGRIKFEMVDRYDVYLHDTPERYLFRRDNRRKSHGCVRVQNPRELASLLSDEPEAAINRAIALGYTHRRALPTPIPVFIVYQTAVVGPDGTVAFLPDAYDRDPEIWQHLHPQQQAPVAEREPGGQRHG